MILTKCIINVLKNVLLACSVDENNEVHIKNTARFRTKDELNNIE